MSDESESKQDETDSNQDDSESKDSDSNQDESDGDSSSGSPESISELLRMFKDETEGEDKVTLGELLGALDSRSHGPMLLVPAVIAVSPIGAIPGLSVITGTIIILIAAQMMIFSKRPWLPKRLEAVEFSRDLLIKTVDKSLPWTKWFEKVVKSRLQFATKGWAIYPIALICILLALSFYPLALIPFGVFLPSLAVTFFALGLTARDGLLILIGLATTIGSGVMLWYLWK